MGDLTHFDESGAAHMVDVSNKASTARIASATGRVFMKAATLQVVLAGTSKKGDVLGVARLAGIMGAKKTPDLIPLCHPLAITKVSVDLEANTQNQCVDINATVKTTGQTGVEMEALTAVNITALTVYDMLKAIDKEMTISDICVTLKDGGKSGLFQRKDAL